MHSFKIKTNCLQIKIINNHKQKRDWILQILATNNRSIFIKFNFIIDLQVSPMRFFEIQIFIIYFMCILYANYYKIKENFEKLQETIYYSNVFDY